MEGRYLAYPEYKDSEVEWLGEIPKIWGITQIKYVSDLTPKKPLLQRDLQCSFVPMEKLKIDSIILDETRVIDDVYDGYTYFEDSDVLMAKVTPCFENKNIAVAKGLVNGVGFGSSEIYVIRVNEKNSNRFLYYRLQEDSFVDIATAAMTGAGGLKRVPSDMIKNYTVALPETEEQEEIANFLDHETAKIDTLIEKQQQLIKLLKEKRQAVISHAVTKGLNPKAPMRDSGVEWLGDVPEHWKVARAKFVSDIFIPQRNKPDLNNSNGIAWATMEDMKGKYIESTRMRVDNKAAKLAGSKILIARSVIASCVGNFGVASINEIEVIINQQLQAYIPNMFPNMIKSEYLREIISVSKTYFELIGTAATLVYVNQQGFENLPVFVPPMEEQKHICKYVETQSYKFNNLIAKCDKTVELMKERRTALISAAVTGKIDVRNWQAPESLYNKPIIKKVAV